MSNKQTEVQKPEVLIVGSVKDGKLALDPSTLDSVAGGGTGKPDDDSFVAVNAPFDPVAVAA
jgi:hypothetical protein